ncbi:hypothetical protein [Roseomonas elaeocarpi]|uniref:DUF3606 domain-containing protein n=1 Tax=Roseomonas elaeocarpi TaxID=907779 RepID=A0ABV6JRM3_9PROT
MSHTKPRSKPDAEPATSPEEFEETVAYLAKRHKVSAAIVREIARRAETTDRSALARAIERDKSRR